MSDIQFRLAASGDEPRLQQIRSAAFAPVFASFRSLLGDEVYDLAQKRDDEAQPALLTALLAAPEWEVYVALLGREITGFVAVRMDEETRIGEIGLNAVDPAYGGQGIGTAMYNHAIRHMQQAGMKVATVSTGGDPSHAPARRAYVRAGFDRAIPSLWMCRRL